jgi:hypothetical protein
MKHKGFALSIALLCALPPISASADQSLDKILNDHYRGKALHLRHFFKSSSQEYDVEGKALKTADEGPWTVYGGIMVRKISIGADAIRVEGKRVAYVFDEHDRRMHPLKEDDDLKIKIRLNAPLTSEDQTNAVLGHVFALTQEDIINSAPQYWQEFLKGQVGPHLAADSAGSTGPGNQPPSSTDKTGEEKVFHMGYPGLTPPRILYRQEPEFSEAARRHNIQGVVAFNIVIDSSGRVNRASIVQPGHERRPSRSHRRIH